MIRLAPLVASLFLGLVVCHAEVAPPEVKVVAEIAYKSGDSLSDYEKERCHLDLYLPPGKTGFPTLVWFHGGGLTKGKKDDKSTIGIGKALARSGIAVAAVNYRLSPKVTFPAYVDDAAAAVAWISGHIAEQGGDPVRLFIGGHSAGGYLTSMLGMDVRYLQKYGVAPEAIAGLIPVSGQMVTHFNVRKERGLPETAIVADEAAPIYFTRKVTPPFLILFGDQDWPGRLEENQYFIAEQKAVGNTQLTLQVIPDRTHSGVGNRIAEPGDPAAAAIVEFIRRIGAERAGAR
jgi:acetyl esterase/lipase